MTAIVIVALLIMVLVFAWIALLQWGELDDHRTHDRKVAEALAELAINRFGSDLTLDDAKRDLLAGVVRIVELTKSNELQSNGHKPPVATALPITTTRPPESRP